MTELVVLITIFEYSREEGSEAIVGLQRMSPVYTKERNPTYAQDWNAVVATVLNTYIFSVIIAPSLSIKNPNRIAHKSGPVCLFY